MKRLLFVLLVVLFAGCGQPKLVKREYNQIKYTQIQNTNRDDFEEVLSQILDQMTQNEVLTKTKDYKYLFAKDGVQVIISSGGDVIINYYEEVSKAKQNEVNKLLSNIKTNLKKRLQTISDLKTKMRQILVKSPEKVLSLYYGFSLLNDKQTQLILKKIANHISIEIKGDRICLSVPSQNLKFKDLEFDVDSEYCDRYSYSKLSYYNTNKQTIYLNHIFFLPNFQVSVDGVDINTSTKMEYNFKDYSDKQKHLTYYMLFNNSDNNYKKISYLTFYYLDDVISYKKDLLIPPYTKTKRSIMSDESGYSIEITPKNKNKLTYGIAFKLNGKTYSYIKTTNFDTLFTKYVK